MKMRVILLLPILLILALTLTSCSGIQRKDKDGSGSNSKTQRVPIFYYVDWSTKNLAPKSDSEMRRVLHCAYVDGTVELVSAQDDDEIIGIENGKIANRLRPVVRGKFRDYEVQHEESGVLLLPISETINWGESTMSLDTKYSIYVTNVASESLEVNSPKLEENVIIIRDRKQNKVWFPVTVGALNLKSKVGNVSSVTLSITWSPDSSKLALSLRALKLILPHSDTHQTACFIVDVKNKEVSYLGPYSKVAWQTDSKIIATGYLHDLPNREERLKLQPNTYGVIGYSKIIDLNRESVSVLKESMCVGICHKVGYAIFATKSESTNKPILRAYDMKSDRWTNTQWPLWGFNSAENLPFVEH